MNNEDMQSSNLENKKNEDEIKVEIEEKNENETEDGNANNASAEPKKKKRIISKTSEVISKLLMFVIVILCVVITIRALVFKKYDVLGCRFYLIMSGSMEPTINVGDAVITKESSDLKEGDIIAFSQDGAITVHRIIKVYNEEAKQMYQTQGDNNNTPDTGLVDREQVKGHVIFKIPKVGTAILFLQRNFIIPILLISLIIIIILVRRLI